MLHIKYKNDSSPVVRTKGFLHHNEEIGEMSFLQHFIRIFMQSANSKFFRGI